MTRFNAPLRTLAAALLVLATGSQVQAASFSRVASGVPTGVMAVASTSGTNDVMLNLAGVNSFDSADAVINTRLALHAAPGATVDALSFNLVLVTIGSSWLSDASVRVVNSLGEGVALRPAFGDDVSGVRLYAATHRLSDDGLSFTVQADGLLYFQFYEQRDNLVNAIDARYISGSITLGGVAVAAVPEPATYGLMGMGLGLLGLAAAARRRRA